MAKHLAALLLAQIPLFRPKGTTRLLPECMEASSDTLLEYLRPDPGKVKYAKWNIYTVIHHSKFSKNNIIKMKNIKSYLDIRQNIKDSFQKTTLIVCKINNC